MSASGPPRAASLGLAGCHTCGKVSPVTLGRCPRCGTPLHLRKPHSLQRTSALLLAAAILYIPANTMPIMTVSELGGTTASTIMGGVATFWQTGSYLIATIIFVASILIPVVKIVALIWLCSAAAGKLRPSPKILGKVFWFTEVVGRWSMVDVFVVAILVALVQIGAFMTITPGPAALAFAAVVVLTMCAAMSFDPRLLWDRFEPPATDADPEPLPASDSPT
jgi:paraquat-inducible protein A